MKDNHAADLPKKKHFLLKLIGHRPNFAMTISEEEQNIMKQHVIYWTDLMNKGFVIVFGPVFDPAEPWGLGIIEAGNDEEVQELIAGDPANAVGRYEVYPMRAVLPANHHISG